MLTAQKNLTFQSYVRWAFHSISTSQFLYFQTNNLLRLRALTCSIQHRKSKKLHYFYLAFLTQQVPYGQKFYLTDKNKALHGVPFAKTKVKKQFLQVTLKPKKQAAVLREILTHIIAKQANVEKAVWTYHQAKIRIQIPFVPLTPKTWRLQAKNSYFPDFSLKLQFDLPFSTAFEKLFFLRMFKFLSPVPKVKNLEF